MFYRVNAFALWAKLTSGGEDFSLVIFRTEKSYFSFALAIRFLLGRGDAN